MQGGQGVVRPTAEKVHLAPAVGSQPPSGGDDAQGGGQRLAHADRRPRSLRIADGGEIGVETGPVETPP